MIEAIRRSAFGDQLKLADRLTAERFSSNWCVLNMEYALMGTGQEDGAYFEPANAQAVN